MAKEKTKQAKATNNNKMKVSGANGFTAAQVKEVKVLAGEADALSKKLVSLFQEIGNYQKIRKVRQSVIARVDEPFTVWKRGYVADTEARSAERAAVKLERISKRREKLVERRRKLDEADAKLEAQLS